MSTSVLRLPVVLERTGYSRSRLYARISEGLFPRPIALGRRMAAWPEHEVEAVIAAHIRETPESDMAQMVERLHSMRATFGLARHDEFMIGLSGAPRPERVLPESHGLAKMTA
ncbi:putative transcriptional regulator [Thiorhodovibrio winogradskyi]|uniref:Transcriptional regulator n=2 Tax=Thiorhodovibrio winogradskyi TaxID=77007 RepID=A0ABZ0SCF6_9GAMM|nr:AlpA family phage regulatory protein [Thiorhodovibrio winogradskyi]